MPLLLKGQDILARVQRQFGDESGVQVQDTDILLWVTDAIREAATQNPKMRTLETTLDAIAGQHVLQIDGGSFTGYSAIGIHALYFTSDTFNQQYVPLTFLTQQEFEMMLGDGVSASTGTPTVYTQDNSQKFSVSGSFLQVRIHPAPVADVVDGFKAKLSYMPGAITTLSQTIDIPVVYSQYVLEYCLMKAYEMDENWEAADRKAQYIQSTLDSLAFRKDVGDDFYTTVTVMLEDQG